MKLGGINITNLGAYRTHFNLEEVWDSFENGGLLKFQKALGRDEDMVEEIVAILEAYEKKVGLSKVISDFFGNSGWKLQELERKFQSLNSKPSRDKDKFYSMNADGIKDAIYKGSILWTEETVVIFYLFLLLMLQAKPKEKISQEDFSFIKDYLSSEAVRRMAADKEERDSRLYPYKSGILYLKDGKIKDEKNQLLSPENETIACYAYTEELGIIAFTGQGEISSCTDPYVRNEIKQMGGDKRAVMAAAYGRIYALLMEDGTILSNAEDLDEKWEDIRWIGAGLNNITAIKGKNRYLLEIGLDIEKEFLEVKEVHAQSIMNEDSRYAVLEKDGTLAMDDGYMVKSVDAASIDLEGYVYATQSDIIIRKFGSTEGMRFKLETGCSVVELCKNGSTIYCRAVCFDKEELLIKKRDEAQIVELILEKDIWKI